MKTTIIILSVLALIFEVYGQTTTTNVATERNQTIIDNNTVEDTVRHQIGGKLFGLTIEPSDSITVIKTNHGYEPNYREYHFIVHNRNSRAYHQFTDTALNSWYNFRITTEFQARDDYERFFRPRADSIQSRHIDPIIKDFNGHWLYLTERNGIYYIDDDWACRNYVRIMDSIYVVDCMEMFMSKILEVTPLPDTLGVSMIIDNPWGVEPNKIIIEVFDKKRTIYLLNGRPVIPVRAIHNFELIQYTNNTGDLI